MAKYKRKTDDDIRCPLEYGLTLFGGKWKSRIICVLSANERLRYSEIRKEMYNIFYRVSVNGLAFFSKRIVKIRWHSARNAIIISKEKLCVQKKTIY